jgi:hypothetical protein
MDNSELVSLMLQIADSFGPTLITSSPRGAHLYFKPPNPIDTTIVSGQQVLLIGIKSEIHIKRITFWGPGYYILSPQGYSIAQIKEKLEKEYFDWLPVLPYVFWPAKRNRSNRVSISTLVNSNDKSFFLQR